MKSFEEYLTESKKTYKFKVRVAGELPEGFADNLERCLQKYDVSNITAGKRSPIQETPLDFPQLKNCEVTHYEVDLNYPCTSHVLEQYLVGACNINHSYICVRSEFDPIDEYQAKPDTTPYESKLNTEELGGESAQNEVGAPRIMDLLKELETARQERDMDMTGGITAGKSKDIQTVENSTSVVGG